MNWKHKLNRNLSSILGWRSNRKIVLIESDDWGSIRMPSLEVLNSLKSKGLDLLTGDSARYNLNDTLETSEDISMLLEALSSFKDSDNNHPVFTPLVIVANPDFERIKLNEYQQYYWEPFTKSLDRFGHNGTFQLYQQGIQSGIFVPEFHGREHLNVASWMRALQQKDEQVHLAFEYGFWGYNNIHPKGIMFQAAFDLERVEDLAMQHEILQSGLELFEKLFGYKASYFVPPNGPLNNSLESTASNFGIQFIFTQTRQKEVLGEGRTRSVLHWLGQKNKFNQHYLMRNAFFEPNQPGKDWVDACLRDIELVFRWGKPAVISTHRTNFCGKLNPKNRSQGIAQLKNLIKKIIIKWPNVEFMSTLQLGNLIARKVQ